MTHYTNHSISVQDNADSAAVIIGSLINVSAPIDQEVQTTATAGRSYPEQVTIASQKPRLSFGSYDLPKVVTAFGLVGRRITGGSGKVGIAQHQAKYNDSALASGSVHRRLRYDETYAHVRRISASHRQDAQIEAEVAVLYDGTNLPIIPEDTQALPTLPTSAGRWTIGKVTVGSVLLSCNIQVDIDFGISLDVYGCDSDIFDTHLNVNQIAPKITITSLTPEGFATSGGVPLAGLIGAHADTKIYLRKRLARGAGFVADATAEHISVTASGILLVNDAFNAQANQRGQMSLMLECDYDGTNAPIVLNTATAIT
jgi:hypothetical protein